MSIADKITSIETHIGDAYDTLELGGADLTNVNKNIQNITPQLKARYLDYLNNGTDEIWNNWEKVTGQGTNISLNNTIYAPMKIDAQGNSIQEGTPTPTSPQPINSVGDNVNLASVSTSGTNTTQYTNIYYKDTNIKTSTTYTISFKGKPGDKYNISSGTYGCAVSAVTITVDSNGIGIGTFTTKDEFTSSSTGILSNNTTNNTLPLTDIKISEGTFTSLPYSPYNMGSITIDKCNKNLWTLLDTYTNDTASQKWVLTDTSVNFPAGTYTFSCKNTNESDNSARLNYKYADNVERYVNLKTSAQITFTEKVLKVALRLNANTTISEIQLEQGSTATTYIPHQSTTYNIYTQASMRSIGEVRDDFAKIGGVWYERHKIGRVVLDGTQTTGRNGQAETYNQYYCTISDKAFGTTNFLSNKFKSVQSGTTVYQMSGRINNSSVYFNLLPTDCEYTIEGIKTWLENNTPEVIYELAEPTLIECTSEQVEQLENIVKAKSYNGVTNIYSNDRVEPYLSCVALKNI